MFTGIVQEIGVVNNFAKSGRVYRLDVSCRESAGAAKIGDSIAVNGVCLTVIDARKGLVSFDVMDETVKASSLGAVKTDSRVNLESALKMGDHLGGHIVQGHIDCTGKITGMVDSRDEVSMKISLKLENAHLVVEKGSVAIDGVSLTVGDVSDRSFKVYLIPHTRAVTSLGERKTGDMVNIEFDVVGKYIARSKELEKKGSGVSEELLRRTNFI